MGLYDGMMNEIRASGQRLPGRSSRVPKKRTARSSSAGDFASMHVHPYSIAVSLGQQIRFSVPLDRITAELETLAPKYLAPQRR